MKKKERALSIVQTGVQCPDCGEVIISLHVHDFCTCGCGSTFIDGGFDYLRVGGKNPTGIKDVKVRINRACLRV